MIVAHTCSRESDEDAASAAAFLFVHGVGINSAGITVMAPRRRPAMRRRATVSDLTPEQLRELVKDLARCRECDGVGLWCDACDRTGVDRRAALVLDALSAAEARAERWHEAAKELMRGTK